MTRTALLRGALAGVLCSIPLETGLAAQPVALEGFDAYVEHARNDWHVPGLAVAIVKDGEVVFLKGYGVRELGKPETVDPATLFAIGSTTKAMTATALGMLVDAGKLKWDDPVTTHLPAFAVADPYVTRQITVRDLLTHRAGLGNTDFLWYEQELSMPQILGRLRLVEPESSMRSRFTYQNVMYATAGEVVAAASGMAWETFIRTRIFEPLQMSGAIPTAAALGRQPDVAAPHYELDGKVTVIRNASVDAVAPAGAVWAGVGDMARWMRFMIEGEAVTDSGGRPLLSARTHAELFTPQTIVGPDGFYPTARLSRPNWTTYGLGWFQQDYRGHKVDMHTGSIDGMVAIIGLIRDMRLGVYVLANLDHAELRHALMFRVFDDFLGGAPRDWSRELLQLYGDLKNQEDAAAAKRDAQRVKGTHPTLALERYVGEYRDPLRGTIAITNRDGRLYARYGPGLAGPLEHWHYDTFRLGFDAAWRGSALLTFEIDASGQVSRLDFGQGRFVRVVESPK